MPEPGSRKDFLQKAGKVLQSRVRNFNKSQQNIFLSSLENLYNDLEDPAKVTTYQLEGVLDLVNEIYPQEFKELQEVYSEQTPPN